MGQHTLDTHMTKTKQALIVNQNRSMLVNFCKHTHTKIMNTTFQKPNEKLVTFRQPIARDDPDAYNRGPPYDRERYEQLDYIITCDKWKTQYKTANPK